MNFDNYLGKSIELGKKTSEATQDQRNKCHVSPHKWILALDL